MNGKYDVLPSEKCFPLRRERKVRDSHLTKIMSEASKFNSPLQIVALAIVTAFLTFALITGTIWIKELHQTVSEFNQVDYIGDKDDVHSEIHLSR